MPAYRSCMRRTHERTRTAQVLYRGITPAHAPHAIVVLFNERPQGQHVRPGRGEAGRLGQERGKLADIGRGMGSWPLPTQRGERDVVPGIRVLRMSRADGTESSERGRVVPGIEYHEALRELPVGESAGHQDRPE